MPTLASGRRLRPSTRGADRNASIRPICATGIFTGLLRPVLGQAWLSDHGGRGERWRGGFPLKPVTMSAVVDRSRKTSGLASMRAGLVKRRQVSNDADAGRPKTRLASAHQTRFRDGRIHWCDKMAAVR